MLGFSDSNNMTHVSVWPSHLTSYCLGELKPSLLEKMNNVVKCQFADQTVL